ncbi:glycosyltransferase [bacterium]|nr:glycosyltransferase [bacterium]
MDINKNLFQFKNTPLRFLAKLPYRCLLIFIKKVRKKAQILQVLFADLIGLTVMKSYRRTLNREAICHPETAKNKVLFFRDGEYGNGIDQSLEKIQISDTLEYFGFTVETVVWGNLGTIFNCRKTIIDKILTTKPTLIIFSSYAVSRKKYTQPNLMFIEWLRKHCPHTKLLSVWWDTASYSFWETFPKQSPFDRHLIVDNPSLDQAIGLASGCIQDKKFVFLFPPYVPFQDFFPQEKEVDVFFSGQINDYRDSRSKFINYLIDNVPESLVKTDARKNQMSWVKYCSLMRKSRMVINFSKSVDGHQIKGRAIEAFFCRALLLETKHSPISKFFEPGIDYVEFETKEDMLEKINFYQKNPVLRDTIASSGHKKALEKATSNNFWQLALDHLEIDFQPR